MIRDWTLDEHRRLRAEAPRLGLRTAHAGGTLPGCGPAGAAWTGSHAQTCRIVRTAAEGKDTVAASPGGTGRCWRHVQSKG